MSVSIKGPSKIDSTIWWHTHRYGYDMATVGSSCSYTFENCHFSLSPSSECVYGMHANAFRDKQQYMKSITASPLVIHNIPSILSRSQRTWSFSASLCVNTVIVLFLLIVPPFQQLNTAATQSTPRSLLILCICFSVSFYVFMYRLLYSSKTHTKGVG